MSFPLLLSSTMSAVENPGHLLWGIRGCLIHPIAEERRSRSRSFEKMESQASPRASFGLNVEVKDFGEKGRGLVSKKRFQRGDLVEESHCIYIPSSQVHVVNSTVLYEYVFNWGSQLVPPTMKKKSPLLKSFPSDRRGPPPSPELRVSVQPFFKAKHGLQVVSLMNEKVLQEPETKTFKIELMDPIESFAFLLGKILKLNSISLQSFSNPFH